MLNWFLVYTKPRNEEALVHKFTDAGIEAFNPKIKERKYVRRRLQDVISPLFPCYIFVKIDLYRQYRLVKYTRGVRKVVGTENHPTVVSDGIVESIMERVENGVITIHPRRFSHGEKILITSGPFEGLDAIFEEELKGMERVSILLTAISARVVVDGAALAKA